ncbi:MAG: ornithine carbamoyltransferase [Granulosicoccus sp.]
MRHFLSELDLTAEEFRGIIQRGSQLRKQWESHTCVPSLPQQVLAMIFEKSSTRTRVSFEAGMTQLGGHAIYLSPENTQLGRGEPMADTARVLSQMVDAITVRTFSHDALERFAEVCTVPVINALTDLLHPCQLLADMQTFLDHRGDITGKRVAWIGDGNNMCNSYINTAKLLGFHLVYACPDGYEPDQHIVASAGNNTSRATSPSEACEQADLVVTDVWASMGQEQEQKAREKAFEGYEITNEMMSVARKNALFMHCLPAHRGEEVSADVIDGEQSVVWEEAGNRLHAQKALLEFLLLDNQ